MKARVRLLRNCEKRGGVKSRRLEQNNNWITESGQQRHKHGPMQRRFCWLHRAQAMMTDMRLELPDVVLCGPAPGKTRLKEMPDLKDSLRAGWISTRS